MILNNKTIEIKAYGPANLFPLSDEINAAIKDSTADTGLVHIFSVGSTGCLAMLGGLSDNDAFAKAVMKKIPWREFHRHPGNAFAHLRSTFIGNEIALSASNGKLKILESQPFLLENTAGRKRRRLVVTFIGGMRMEEAEFDVEANGWIDIVNVSRQIEKFTSGTKEGLVYVETATPGTAMVTIEYEPALLLDTADFFAKLLDDVHEENRAGVAAAFLPQTLMIPIREGRISSGVWQQISIIDFGLPGKKRLKLKRLIGDDG